MYSRNRIPANRSLMIGPMYQSRVSSQLLTRALLNFCSFPLSSQNATVLSVAAAWTKNEINANSVVSSTKEYSLDQRSGHFLRQSAPPTYARSCRNNG